MKREPYIVRDGRPWVWDPDDRDYHRVLLRSCGADKPRGSCYCVRCVVGFAIGDAFDALREARS